MNNLETLRDAMGDFQPQLGIVLGSGLGFLADEAIKSCGSLPYEELEHFPQSTVPGHRGRFVFGWLGGCPVLCMQGRVHVYEGYSLQTVTVPLRLMIAAGIQQLLLTNAAGGIRRDLVPGDFMLIRDHINFLGGNPLIGLPAGDGERFPDMTEAYDAGLRKRMQAAAADAGIALKQGVYLATTGPCFETPAEIRAFEVLGADAVGMSTVPEVIVARRHGIAVVGVSCITNAAAGLSDGPLSHGEVETTAKRVRTAFGRLVQAFAVRSAGTHESA